MGTGIVLSLSIFEARPRFGAFLRRKLPRWAGWKTIPVPISGAWKTIPVPFLVVAAVQAADYGVTGTSKPDVVVVASAGGRNTFFPTIERLDTGELVVVYYDSPGHTSPTGRVSIVRSSDNGRTWSPPQVALDTPADDRDPSIMRTRRGTLLLSFFAVEYGGPTALNLGTFVARSVDNGRSWSAPARVGTKLGSASAPGGSSTSAKIVELDSGDLLVPIYGSTAAGERLSTVVRSVDDGRSWPAASERDIAKHPTIGFVEPALVNVGGGHIFAVMRTVRSDNGSYEVHSYDHGVTWTPPVRSPMLGHASDLLLVRGGRWPAGSVFHVWGDVSGTLEAQRPVAAQLWVPDGGWTTTRSSLVYAGRCGDESYPSSAQIDDETMLIVFYDACAGYIGSKIFKIGRATTISRAYPLSGSISGGTPVVITGSGFDSSSNVSFDNVVVPVTVINSTTIRASAPPHAAGPVDLAVTNASTRQVVSAPRTYTYLPSPTSESDDSDSDGMPDAWEILFNLDPRDPDDSGLDADGDGITNGREHIEGSHPRGAPIRYFAEGAASEFFETTFALVNPGEETGIAVMRFFGATGFVARSVVLPPMSRRTVRAGEIPGISREFSTIVEADVPVAVDRLMTWAEDRSAAHADSGTGRPSTTWYLAEGATHSGFNLFYLLFNPASSEALVDIEYLRSGSSQPVSHRVTVLSGGRSTIWVNKVDARLSSAEVSATVRSTVPLIVERSMYADARGRPFAAGHGGTASPSLARSWYFAEGATGPIFDTFMLIANPGRESAALEATYLLTSGERVKKRYTIAPQSRATVWVDLEDPRLADTSFSCMIDSDVPVVAERTMWWSGSAQGPWLETHNNGGAVDSASAWVVPNADTGQQGKEVFVLIGNLASSATDVQMTAVFEQGERLVRSVRIPGSTRYTFAVADAFPEARNKPTGVIVDAGSTGRLVVESASYWNPGGIKWRAGTAEAATKWK